MQSCEHLESVSLPNTLKSIGHDAFNCSNLSYVEVPESVESIGAEAFYTNSEQIDIYIYNPNCEFEFDEHRGGIAGLSNAVIHGFKGSTAEDLVNEQNANYKGHL